ncbi:MAG: NAD-dependent epimerase/dehydratase family protein, partial [Candidatus Thorarchaeota archaeon]
MTKSALVSGCAGFIASHLVDKLIEKGYDVIGIDNMYSGQESNMSSFISSDKFRFIKEDISKPMFGTDIHEDVNIIFHLAAISSVQLSVENPMFVNQHNVLGTLNMLELARKKDVDCFVISSSAAVYGDPDHFPINEETQLSPLRPYAASKIAAEEYIRAYQSSYGIDSVILRYFNIFGPRQAYSEYSGVISIFANLAVKGLPLKIDGNGLQSRSFVYVSDVVRATILASKINSAAGKTFNVSNTESVTIQDVAKQIVETFKDKKIEITYGPQRIGDVKESI